MNRTQAIIAILALALTCPLTSFATTFHITDSADDFTPNGNCTLREAIVAANLDRMVDECPPGSAGDLIELDNQIYTLTLGGEDDFGKYGDLDITEDLIIEGNGALITIDLNSDFVGQRIFEIWNNVEIHNLVIRGAYAAQEGAAFAIRQYGTLKLTDSLVLDCHSDQGGGAAYVGVGAELTLGNARFIRNSTGRIGGALWIDGGEVSVVSQVILGGNRADVEGGGLYISSGTLMGSGLRILANRAGDSAGFVFEGATVNLENLNLASNEAEFAFSIGRISASDVQLNRADLRANRTVDLSTIPWALLFSEHSQVRIEDSRIAGNQGSIQIDYNASVTLSRSSITGNKIGGSAVRDGAVLAVDGAELFLTNVTVAENTAMHGSVEHAVKGASLISSSTLLGGHVSGRIRNSIIESCETLGITSFGNNIVRGPGCHGAAASDLTGVNPLAPGLRNFSGLTSVMTLDPGSVAIDGGDSAGCLDEAGQALAVDQTGHPRHIGQSGAGRCDIGAFEFDPDRPPAGGGSGPPHI